MRLAEGQEGAKAQMPCNLLIASEASEEMLVIVHVYILQNPFFSHRFISHIDYFGERGLQEKPREAE